MGEIVGKIAWGVGSLVVFWGLVLLAIWITGWVISYTGVPFWVLWGGGLVLLYFWGMRQKRRGDWY